MPNKVKQVLFVIIVCQAQSVLGNADIVEVDTLLASRYFKEAEEFFQVRELSKAIVYYKRAGVVYQEEGQINRYVATLNRLAFCYMRKSKNSEAMNYLHEAMSLNNSVSRNDSLEYAYSLNVMAGIYAKLGLIDEALRRLQQSFHIRKKHLSEDALGSVYSNFGTLHLRRAEMERAIEYFLLALELYRKQPSSNKHNLFILHRNFGTAFMYLQKNEEAMNHYKKAINYALTYLDSQHSDIADVLGDMGYLFWQMGDFDEALKYGLRAIKMLKEWPDRDFSDLSRILLNVGILYRDLGQYETSNQYFQRSLEWTKSISGPKSHLVSYAFRLLGNNHRMIGNLDTALRYSQESLIAVSPDFISADFRDNPQIENYYEFGLVMLNSLSLKAEILESIGVSRGRMDYQLWSLNTYLSCDSLIRKTRISRQHRSDKMNVGKISREIYLKAFHLCYNLFVSTNDVQYLNYMFHFCERSKTGMIEDRIATEQSVETLELTDSLVVLEDSLRENVSIAQTRILSEKDADSSSNWIGLIKAKGALESHLAHRNQYGPGMLVPLSPKDVSSGLDAQSAFLEYFMTQDHLFTFIITGNQTTLLKTSVDSTFYESLSKFRKSIQIMEPLGADQYQASRYLFTKLLKGQIEIIDSINSQVSRLIIVPDNELGYLPFELLLTKDEIPSDTRNWPFVLRDYSIAYYYSAQNVLSKVRVNDSSKKYIGFAPSYEKDGIVHYKGDAYENETISDLLYSEQEVQTIEDYIGGTVYKSEYATEHRFKREVNDYRIVHLAMHAVVDEEDPMNSKLLFSPSDTIEDGYLHVYELYNMKIDAELAVLSACKTGYGKLARGEGIMSLGMGFAYAGVPSMVISHWNASDIATADLMKYFYQYLFEGKPKDVALRQAKLDFLETATPDIAHPYFWGGFVVIGDTSPIDLRSDKREWVVISVIALLLIIILGLIIPSSWKTLRSVSLRSE